MPHCGGGGGGDGVVQEGRKETGVGGFVNRYTSGIHIIHNDFMLSFA